MAADVVVTWDENAAGLLRRAWNPARHVSGVVWLTDRPDGPYAGEQVELLRRCAATWVLSDAQQEPLARLLGPNAPPVHVVRFGIDSDFYAPAPYPDRPMVFSVGNDQHRDTETLLVALSRVHDAVPDAELVVQSRTVTRPPAGVTVVPALSHAEVRDHYARATVVAVATHHNLHVSGMTVGLEAHAVARPVVMTRTPGIDGYLNEEVDSLLVPEGDPKSLADQVIRLLADPRMGESMGQRGRAKIERHHTETSLASQLLRIVADVATGEAEPRPGSADRRQER